MDDPASTRPPERAPYSPRTFRQPGETEEQWKRRSNRARKLRWRKRHPERVRAQKRGHHARHREEINEHRREDYEAAIPRVSQERLEYLRAHIREAITDKDITCLECGAVLVRLANHLLRYHPECKEDRYREKWGYDRTTPLCAKEEAEEVQKEAKRRHWGSRLVEFRFEEGHTDVRVSRTLRLEERMNRSERQRGKAQPKKWKRTPDGQVVTDARLAILRLQGCTLEEIARATGLSIGSVYTRLMFMGFPTRRACLYSHGEPVSGATLAAMCEDFGKSSQELSERLLKDYDWVADRMSRVEPLPPKIAKHVLRFRDQLRADRKTAPTAEGGRPSPLTPSERAGIPSKFRALQHDLRMLQEALNDPALFARSGQSKPTKVSDAWAWLCDMQRQGKLQTLFFWREFWTWVEQTHGDMVLFQASLARPTEVALEFMADDYGVTLSTIDHIARNH